MDRRKTSTPDYEVLVEHDVMMPLRDGVRLACDLYLPASDGARLAEALPVLLMRTPYDKHGPADTARFYAARGYAVALQDVRGRYASEGVFYGFRDEGPDGYDTVEWLAAQPWCNGRVGTFGASYCAAVQTALAAYRPPHLAAMIPTFGPSSFYHCSMRHNGALEQRFYVYAFTMAATSQQALADPALKAVFDQCNAEIWDWIRQPLQPGCSPLALLPEYEQWCLDLLAHVCYDDYWRAAGYGPRPYYDEFADVPTLYVGGWYDTYTRATLENYVALHPRQSAPVHVLMGPWTHDGPHTGAGDLRFPHDGCSNADYEAARLRWFDHWLKDLPTGLDIEPPVRYFLMGGGAGPQADQTVDHGGQWLTAPDWPTPAMAPTPWYLHGGGTLSPEPPGDDPLPTTYPFDPAQPVPTIGGHLSALPLPGGGFDQRNDPRFAGTHGSLPLSARADVLCFTSAPLAADLVLAGPVEVVLYVATDGRDTDFTTKLIDWYPPSPAAPAGYALNLTDSIRRLRFRNGYEVEELAVPGEVYELRCELYPVANRFAAGHRVRVDISSSNWPRFDPNPNTGRPLNSDRTRRVALNSLYHGRTHPTRIVLPVVGQVAP